MTFVAKLRRQSRVWTAWRHRRATSGEIEGVVFRWCPGDDYATGELTVDQVMRLRGQPDVTLEAYGVGLGDCGNAPARTAPEPVAPDVTTIRAGTLTAEETERRSIPHTPGWRKRLREATAAAARH